MNIYNTCVLKYCLKASENNADVVIISILNLVKKN